MIERMTEKFNFAFHLILAFDFPFSPLSLLILGHRTIARYRIMPKPIPTPYSTILPPTKAEQEAVHEVYEAIAPHFSLTRYKPWPLVSQFLSSLPPHTFGLDSGGGNGKYSPLGVNGGAGGREVVVLDMSWGLLSVARDSRSVPASTSTTTTGSTTEGEGKRDGGKIECMRGELGYNGWRDRVFVSLFHPEMELG